jgi:predicted nucleic acid-binding protein
MADLAIAATARVEEAVLLTANAKDFKHIQDLVAVRTPPTG